MILFQALLLGYLLGTIPFGLFFTCFFLFAKYFPTIAVAEIKFVLKTSGESYKKEMRKIEAMSTEEFAASQHESHAPVH